MNTLLNIKAFLLVSRTGAFSAASKELGVSPSVVTKRISRLEEEMGTQLFTRSTRGITLTDAGERLLPHAAKAVAELEELITGAALSKKGIEGHLRIKAPTTITSLYLGNFFCDFLVKNPNVNLDVVLLDRSVNPMEENYDIAFGAQPVSYPYVTDIPLCEYPLVICASPEYLKGISIPKHPKELVDYDCISSELLGTTWTFETSQGAISIEVHLRYRATDAHLLLDAALKGLGLVALPQFIVESGLHSGKLTAVLEDFPVTMFWLKALIPSMKLNSPPIHEFVTFLKNRVKTNPPWKIPARQHTKEDGAQ